MRQLDPPDDEGTGWRGHHACGGVEIPGLAAAQPEARSISVRPGAPDLGKSIQRLNFRISEDEIDRILERGARQIRCLRRGAVDRCHMERGSPPAGELDSRPTHIDRQGPAVASAAKATRRVSHETPRQHWWVNRECKIRTVSGITVTWDQRQWLFGRLLPGHHLSTDGKDVVRLGTRPQLDTAAFVLGLLVASVKGSHDTQSTQVSR